MLDAGTIAQRLNDLRADLPDNVRLIAVSKQMPAEAIRIAYAAGVRDFGESRIQEAIAKQEELKDLPEIVWHFIGHLQTNKAQLALEHMNWIHSLDSLKLAQRLNELLARSGWRSKPAPKFCLQVKFAPDPNKYGWDVAELEADLPHLEQLTHLDLCGLMTITPLGLADQETLQLFQAAAQFTQELQGRSRLNLPKLPELPELSMGMSNDYKLAIQAGATMIRLGRVLFGDR